MAKTIRARVVGQALELAEPIDLPDGTQVEVVVSPLWYPRCGSPTESRGLRDLRRVSGHAVVRGTPPELAR